MANEVKTMTKRQRAIKTHAVAYSFIAPNFIGFAVFTLVPMVFAIVLGFMEWDGSNPMKFVGFDNFIKLGSDTRFQDALRHTIVYAVASVPLTAIAALLLAIVLNQKIVGRNIFRTINFFPYVASLVAITTVWNNLFNRNTGPVNMFLRSLGMENPPGWAGDTQWAMVYVIMFTVWKYMGYYMVIYLAGLQGVNPELYEAADLDGANVIQKFRYVTIPQLSSTTFFVIVMMTIQCFKMYDVVYLLTWGGPGTSTMMLVQRIYELSFEQWNLGYASTIAIVLFGLVLLVTVVQFAWNSRHNDE